MVPKILLVCLSAAILVSLEKATAKNIVEQFSSRKVEGSRGRVRRASEDVLSYVEDLLGGEEEEQNDKVKYSECGLVDLQPTPLITLGEKSERGKWPWHIALYYFEKGGHSYKCGGTLIGRRTVITAAHCVKNNADQTLNPEILLVYLGKHHLKFWNGVQELQVVDVIVHPDYSITKSIADIAILILSSPADYTSLVRPACLWDNNQAVEKGTPGTVIGWGLDEKGMVTGELMMAKMPIVSDLTCIKSYPEFFGKIVNDMNFCAGYRNGTSACNGDSGGGMVFPIFHSSSRIQKWYLRGIVSLSPGVDNTNICDPNHYVIFTDVGKYFDWIVKHLR